MTSFGDFIKAFGFETYPFNAYTSESELDMSRELFVDTSMYGPLVEAFRARRTMLISGDRGTGKTAIIQDFLRKSDKNSNLVVNITDYAEMKLGGKTTDFYEFVIPRFSDQLFESIAADKKNGGTLTAEEKIQLSYYLARFTKPETKGLL